MILMGRACSPATKDVINQYPCPGGAKIDVLYIDTSHTYDHTLSELEAWEPLLSEVRRLTTVWNSGSCGVNVSFLVPCSRLSPD
jgi:cephalosporin hydroxylase